MAALLPKEIIDPTPQLPDVSVEDLALMLELDLYFGRRPDFVRRLRRALDAVVALQEVTGKYQA